MKYIDTWKAMINWGRGIFGTGEKKILDFHILVNYVPYMLPGDF